MHVYAVLISLLLISFDFYYVPRPEGQTKDLSLTSSQCKAEVTPLMSVELHHYGKYHKCLQESGFELLMRQTVLDFSGS